MFELVKGENIVFVLDEYPYLRENVKGLDSILQSYESAMFYPLLSNEDKVRIYSVFGGIPYFNRLIDDKKSVKENIIRRRN